MYLHAFAYMVLSKWSACAPLQGQLEAWVDMHALEAFPGVEQLPDAIEYMLMGRHVGKVVTKIAGT